MWYPLRDSKGSLFFGLFAVADNRRASFHSGAFFMRFDQVKNITRK
jgi:hypothetical protein